MKNFTTLIAILILSINSFHSYAQAPQWKYIRPSNTGLGGEFLICIEADACGNKWTGGYLPFWSEGSVTRFNDTTFTNWSNFEGYIPADRVYGIAFDNNDGVWVATNGVGNGVAHGGIAHYDGTTWTQYTTLNTPMPADDMRGITVDENNNVWATFLSVGSGVGGIVKFDGTNWTVYTPTNSGLPTTQVDKIASDSQNNIWIGTNLGLVKFDGFNWITYHSQNSGISSNNVKDVEYDETTNKIYAVTGLSVDIFDGTTWTHINSNNSPVSSSGLYSVAARGDSVVITTVGGTYLTYIYDGVSWISHPETDHTYDSVIDVDGNFWICGNGFLEKYDGTAWTRYNVFNSGLPSMFNNDIYTDSKNRTWFGSSGNGGISMFDCPNWQSFNPYNSFVWPQPIDYTGSGTGITEDIYGNIWMLFSGVAGGVVQVDGGDVNDPAAWHVWDNNNSGVSLQFVNRVAADLSGNVWVGYDDVCSVSRYENATNTWTNYNLFQLGLPCGVGSGVNSIRVDDSNNVWICLQSGIAKYNQVNWTFYSYQNTPMSQGFVFDIAFDDAGTKWIASENGLYKYDNINWTHYSTSNTPMMGNSVKAVLVDESNKIWIGCVDPIFPYPAGMLSFDGTNWTTYTTANSGLQEKYVIRLSLDTLGNIWVLSETKGAAIFNPSGVVGYDCIDKTLQSCQTTSISELNQNELPFKMNVYPNPATANSTISIIVQQNADFNLNLYDVTGKLVSNIYSGKLPVGDNEMKINTQLLKKGIFILEGVTGQTTERIRLVVI